MKSESDKVTGVIQGTDSRKVSEIAELIRSESSEPEPAETEIPGAPGEPVTDSESEPEPSEPAPPAIDYELVIPISASDGDSEGESQTIAQLKDHYQANKSFESDREAWELTRGEQDNEAMVARLHLNALAEQLGGVAPEALKLAREQLGLNAEHEARMVLQVFPDWKKPEVKKAASELMLATASEYGFSEAQYMAIDDHRQIKVLHDLAKFKQQARAGRKKLEEAAATTKAIKPATPQIKPTPAESVIQRARTGTETDKIRAIGSLIEKAESDGKPSR